MFIEHLQIDNFRNITHQEVKFLSDINIFYGDNAQGKTNLLEAMYLCGIGKSFRARHDKELINFESQSANLKMIISKDGGKDCVEISLNGNLQKNIVVNSQKTKKLGDLLGLVYMVMFSPDDLQLIKNGPSERRKFIDVEMCQLSKLYYAHIKRYFHVLKQRNAVLKNTNDINEAKEMLSLWDNQLVESGIQIIKLRSEFVENLSVLAEEIHGEITNNDEKLKIIYKPNVSEEEFLLKLEKNVERDFYSKTTSCGIHKDDLLFYINDVEAKTFASQGQTRTICLSLKLAEISYIRNITGYSPILLLDDVFSELDENRQSYLIKSINSVQTFITCTGVEDIIKKNKKKFNIFSIKKGKISFENGKNVL